MYPPFLLRFNEGYQSENAKTSILISTPDPIHEMDWILPL